jgi:hypothetical protein
VSLNWRSPMATKLSSAVEGVLSQHFAEEGHLLDGFVGMVNYIDEDGARCWGVLAPDQFVDRSFAMADHLSTYFEMMRDLGIAQYLMRSQDDD